MRVREGGSKRKKKRVRKEKQGKYYRLETKNVQCVNYTFFVIT